MYRHFKRDFIKHLDVMNSSVFLPSGERGVGIANSMLGHLLPPDAVAVSSTGGKGREF